MTKDDFTRAVAVATVSALRHQQAQSVSPARPRASVVGDVDTAGVGGHTGHEAPEWSRMTSAAVLLACTALYAIIAGMSCINGDVLKTDQNFRAAGRCRGLRVKGLGHR